MQPVVSVVMPARNAEASIAEALRSATAQTLDRIEVLVVDDGSSDATAEIVQGVSRGDSRVRYLKGLGQGPASARNIGFGAATGDWVAVLDADDILLPDRLDRLVREGRRHSAQIVADNLRAFYDDGRDEHDWLTGPAWQTDGFISLARFLGSGLDGRARDELGYLKPIFARRWLAQNGLKYAENLAIGEDYDLVARCLAAGAAYRYVARPAYRYRRHSRSTSHRIRPDQIEAIMAGLEGLRPDIGMEARTVLDRRLHRLDLDRRFALLVEDLKAGRLQALAAVVTTPALGQRLVLSAVEGLTRRLRPAKT